MNQGRFVAGRQWCIPQATGVVLEIGFGAGANLPYYNNISQLLALEPSKELFKIALESSETTFDVKQIVAGAETIPLDDDSVDSIVCTWTLCSVDDVREVVDELHRVLRPSGKVIFIEHGKSNSRVFQVLQSSTNNLWKRFAGGCNLNRTYFNHFTEAGFSFEVSEQIGTEYRGVATTSK